MCLRVFVATILTLNWHSKLMLAIKKLNLMEIIKSLIGSYFVLQRKIITNWFAVEIIMNYFYTISYIFEGKSLHLCSFYKNNFYNYFNLS
jgi:hypothetical protein